MNILDKVPAPVRHLLIVAGAVFGGYIVQAVLAAHGVSGVDWSGTLVDAVDATAVAVATAAAALWLTPLTSQYGVGASGSSD